jgi:hypothetical protein
MVLAKAWIRGTGIVLTLIGVMTFPVGSSQNPERWTSRYYPLADLGVFGNYGLVLVFFGLVLVLISFLIRDKN